MKTQPNSAALGIGITDLLASLDAHIAHMTPDQKERTQGDLLIRATAELRRLKSAIDETLETNRHLADGHQCALLGLKVALGFKPHDLSTVEGATALMASSANKEEWTRNALAISEHNKYHVNGKWWHKIVLYTEPQFVKDCRSSQNP